VATFISNSAAETEALGQQFAEKVAAGSILALQGELGAGKTVFTKGLVAALGSDNQVTSPTFTILHEYSGGRLPVFHFDFFRLENNEERLRQIGLDDYFFGEGVSVIEWPDRFPTVIPQHACWIRFEMQAPDKRAIHLE
jgi:tRNA threonylcarbamoyladenosine biosynthesis protein TsaE